MLGMVFDYCSSEACRNVDHGKIYFTLYYVVLKPSNNLGKAWVFSHCIPLQPREKVFISEM